MQNKTVEILICTMNEGIDNVIAKMLPQLNNVLVTISHQVTNEKYISNTDWPNYVQYLVLKNTGLSKNRNNALVHARGDICVIADDDIRYIKDFKTKIESAYKKYPDATAVTFQAVGMEKWKKDFEHNWKTVGQVASWMITFDRKKIIDNDIQFDEKFGLGAQYPQGEENIFLADIRKAGGLVVASPELFVHHPDISSGYIFTPERVIAKVATTRRMYGWFAGFTTLAVFSITKYKYYRKNFGPLSFLRYGMKALV